jgi:outer membrane lipoprotein-sorting protein
MSRRTIGLLVSLPFALGFTTGLALAQDPSTTVVPKTPSTTGTVTQEAAPQQPASQEPSAPAPSNPQTVTGPQDDMRPAQDLQDEAAPAESEPYDAARPLPGGAAAPAGEINPNAGDEGAGWDAAVEAAPRPTPLVGERQSEAVQRINAYFNAITNLQGAFEQVDATNKHATGRFYVQRPGKLRFDYAPPSALRIVADGHFLAIEDADLKTVEKYPLETTPFRLLLTDVVDLDRDARIVGIEQQDGTLAIALADKTGDAAGQIKLYFETGPELQLKQWVITDAQGLTTRVTVNDVVVGRKVAADFFASTDAFQPFR